MISAKPRKQRKMLYNAPLHKKRKWVASHLEESLLIKYDRRSVPVIKGDTVRVMRGSFKGHEGKVTSVDVKKGCVEIEGITLTKADGNKVPKPIHASNVLITKLNLTDRWRRMKLTKSLPETAKKEIEKEAEEQLKEIEEAKKQKEVEKKEEEIKEEQPVEKEKSTVEKEKRVEERVEEDKSKKSLEKKEGKSEKSVNKKTTKKSSKSTKRRKKIDEQAS